MVFSYITTRSLRSSGENSALSTPSSGVYSSSEIFSPNGSSMDKNGNDTQMDYEEDFNDVDNLRNQQIERSTVSDIVSRLNNWSVSNVPQDWEKLKRRPVVSANEMEKELTQDANANAAAVASQQMGSSPAREEKLPGDGKESIVEKKSPGKYHTTNGKLEQDLANNNHNHKTATKNNCQVTTTEKKEATKLKRIKGSLKSNDSNKRTMKIPLGRRVSFDPLALLLDASLEGELELVKKTSLEVCLHFVCLNVSVC